MKKFVFGMVVLAASRPNDCFHMAYEASRLALEHMMPVILLTDGYVANGAEPWKIPDLDKEYLSITHKMVKREEEKTGKFLSYNRDSETLVREWAIPGMKGYEHRIGGLEKADVTGAVSHEPENHQKMTEILGKIYSNEVIKKEILNKNIDNALEIALKLNRGN